MARQAAAMHVARIRSGYTDKQGRRHQYESRYLRRTYRDGATVRHETLANLSGLPEQVVDAIEAALKGTAPVPARQAAAVTITRSLPHGHVAAVHAMAVQLGLPRLPGPARPGRDLALALVISRVAAPASKLSTLTWWSDVTLGADLSVDGATSDQVSAAMDWLEGRQDAIEARLARRHLAPQANPSRMALFGLSSSWLEGRCAPLGARGYSRDGKKGKLQIEYGLLTDPDGRPVAVRVLPGNTGDPAALTEITEVVRNKFGLRKMVMAGDRGMITAARIKALKELDGSYGWITALRAPAINKLMADDGPLQLSLLDEQDLARDLLPGLPRRAAGRLPQPGAGRRARPQARRPAGRHREAARPPHRPRGGRAAARRGRDRPRRRQGDQHIQDRQALRPHHHRYQPGHRAPPGPDRRRGRPRRVLRAATPVPASQLNAPGVVTAYKNLKYAERDFRHIKAGDLDLRPVFHRLGKRVKAHVLIGMLAAYLTWHLRRAWAPLTYTGQDPPAQANPLAPARRSAAAQAKAARQHDENGRPYRSFRGLLAHLATLTRNQVRFAGTPAAVPVLSEPTSEQRQAFGLIGVPVPLALK